MSQSTYKGQAGSSGSPPDCCSRKSPRNRVQQAQLSRSWIFLSLFSYKMCQFKSSGKGPLFKRRSLPNLVKPIIIHLSLFLLATLRHMEFLVQRSDLNHNCDLLCCCGNAGSFNLLCRVEDRTCILVLQRHYRSPCATAGTPSSISFWLLHFMPAIAEIMKYWENVRLMEQKFTSLLKGQCLFLCTRFSSIRRTCLAFTNNIFTIYLHAFCWLSSSVIKF